MVSIFRVDKPVKRKCGNCRSKLPKSCRKLLCETCISSVAGAESASNLKELMVSMKEVVSSFQAFNDRLAGLGPSASVEVTVPQAPSVSSRSLPPLVLETVSSHAVSDPEEGENSDSSSDEDSGSGIEETVNIARYLFPLKDIEELLKAVFSSEQIEPPQKSQSVQDRMYRGLQGRKPKCFPVHQSLKDMVLSEWKEPEKRLFQSRGHKRRFPF